MDCCQTQNYNGFFDRKIAEKELKNYQKKGPDKTTKVLIDVLKSLGMEGLTLLDIGGGIGVIQHELLKDGIVSAVSVDASKAYIEVSKEEAERNGNADRITFYCGNFVELAFKFPKSDIVTLDRVICCYPDMWSLVGLSSQLVKKYYGLVYPRDTWWVKKGVSFANFFLWILHKNFRTFVHPTQEVDQLIPRFGFVQRFYHKTLIWQIVIYGKPRFN